MEGARARRRATRRCSPCRWRRTRGEGCGVVLVCFADERRFTDDDLELARQLAHAARGALERSELYESERSARALAQQLARTGSLLATELDPDTVLEEVVQHAPRAARRRRVRDPHPRRRRARAHRRERRRRRGAASGSRSPRRPARPATSTSRRSSAVVTERHADDRATPRPIPCSRAGYSAYLGVPLVGPEGTVARRALRSTRDARARGGRRRSRRSRRSPRTRRRALSNAELFTSVARRPRAELRDPREHRRRHRRRRPRRRTSSSGTPPPSGSRASRRPTRSAARSRTSSSAASRLRRRASGPARRDRSAAPRRSGSP